MKRRLTPRDALKSVFTQFTFTLPKKFLSHLLQKKHPSVLVNTWVGSVANEKGGASLKFEDPLDDVSTVDTRWTRRMVLRMLELLYYEEQWERLADVAMRYNVLTQ